MATASQRGFIRIFSVSSSGKLSANGIIEPREVAWAISHVDWLGEDAILYSSMHNKIYLAKVPKHGTRSPPQRVLSLQAGVGVFSFAVAPGGVELTAATSDGRAVIYDIEGERISESFVAHRDDINSVCYASSSGEGADTIVTGSDDGLIKIFDRRVARGSGATNAASILVGNRAGISCVSARGDGRYVLSNGKDQALRIWDLRKAVPSTTWKERDYALPFRYDYRWEHPRAGVFKTAQAFDSSVATLRGHTVLRTLIRAAWSPLATTGGRYIASGSADGGTYIWDLLDICGGDATGEALSGPRSGLPCSIMRVHEFDLGTI